MKDTTCEHGAVKHREYCGMCDVEGAWDELERSIRQKTLRPTNGCPRGELVRLNPKLLRKV
jgi:hypothetical protein